mmetsp:Transcript_135369/g.350803  ORF Transcript_135369/g.350803 Transcript_135369/m.350803 type:complete len:239 (-) Transcript_135369:1634-2350(-)
MRWGTTSACRTTRLATIALKAVSSWSQSAVEMHRTSSLAAALPTSLRSSAVRTRRTESAWRICPRESKATPFAAMASSKTGRTATAAAPIAPPWTLAVTARLASSPTPATSAAAAQGHAASLACSSVREQIRYAGRRRTSATCPSIAQGARPTAASTTTRTRARPAPSTASRGSARPGAARAWARRARWTSTATSRARGTSPRIVQCTTISVASWYATMLRVRRTTIAASPSPLTANR